jgi:penicillin-binding protein 1A
MALRARRRRRRRSAPTSRRGLKIAAFVVIVAGIAAVAGTAFTGVAVVNDCTLQSLRPLSFGENSIVYAANGARLGVIPSLHNRQPLKLDEMSPWLPKATVAIEDKRFYKHGGLDYEGIARAAVEDLRKGKIVQGGSSITQQLVRNLYIGNRRRTFSRKIKEACLALKLGKAWPKQRILAAYLNEVPYGNLSFGAEAAARTYFARSARRLTLSQAATLAGLPQAPTLYNPFQHPEAAQRRRDEVLRAMFGAGTITANQFTRAASKPLGLKRGQLYSYVRHPDFFGYVQERLIDVFGLKRVQSGGLEVTTTLDQRLQSLARQAIVGRLRLPTDPAAALVAIDPTSGAVKAMVSYAPGRKRLRFNLASQGHRQAGSAFKPFVLATAVKQGVSLYSSFSGPSQITIPDARCYTGTEPWQPANYADESGGTMSLIDATAHSVNTIFAQLVVKVGPENVVDTAHAMGIESELAPVCSITLGSQAVTPLEMTDAYATFAARGVHHPVRVVQLVRGPRQETIGRLDRSGTRVLTPEQADTVTYALQGVVERGTGTAAAIGRPVAGKTGTAENFQDAWFCGFVPQLVACVWIGYPHAEVPLYNVEGWAQVFGGSLPAEIWRDFMSPATATMPVRYFTRPYIGGQLISGSGVASSSDSSSSSSSSPSNVAPSSSSSSSSSASPPPPPAPAPDPGSAWAPVTP